MIDLGSMWPTFTNSMWSIWNTADWKLRINNNLIYCQPDIQSNLGVVTLFSVKNRTSEKNLKYRIFSHTTLYKISS